MSSLAQAKTLGGIGSILLLVSFIPYAGGILGLIGLVLILIAVNYISEAFRDKSIFNNMLISVILAVVGVIVGVVLAFAFMFPFFRGFVAPYDMSMFMAPRFLTAILLFIIPVWIFYIASAIFLRKSYNAIASKLNINMFSTAASLYLIGAVLAIIFIGFILIFVAEILQVVAYFSIPDQATQPSQPAVQPV